MIFKGSRYESTGTYQATDADGRVVVALVPRAIPPTPAGYYHTFVEGDRLDLLAYKFYRNPEKWWRIADANDAVDPDDLATPGRTVLIPPDRS
jgi:nucleoid-associated protein YgaU